MPVLQLKKAYPTYIDDLNQSLKQHGFHDIEGNSGSVDQQKKRLRSLCEASKSIIEIGFNAGHSSLLFLESTNAIVLSFDINAHPYVSFAKKYIDQHFPKRHQLILGNSLQTVPSYIQKNPGKKWDFIFIDGGHDENVARMDLLHCKPLAHQNTIVAMDDVVSQDSLHTHYTLGPTKAWNEAVHHKWLVTLGQENYGIGRGMIWGKYQ